jgi:hypothetical protein
MLLSESTRDRLLAIGERLALELAPQPMSVWPAVLHTHDDEYGVRFSLAPEPGPPDHRGPGPSPGGPQPPPGDGPPPGPPPEGPPEPPPGGGPGGVQSRAQRAGLVSLTRLGGTYRVSIPAAVAQAQGDAKRIMLRADAASLPRLLAFLGIADWALFMLLGLLLSALLWWPLVWSITRTVKQIMRTT